MTRQVSPRYLCRGAMSAHMAAGVAATLMSVPVGALMNRSERVEIFLTISILVLLYGLLFLLYRALEDLANVEVRAFCGRIWFLLGAVAVFLASTTWAIWVWFMGMSLASVFTYVPLLAGIAGLWIALGAGAIVQAQVTRKGPVRAVV